MSNGANSQNEVASSSDATASSGGSSSPAPTPAPAAEVIDVDAEKKAVPVILPAPVHNSRTGDVYQLPAETIKAVDDFPVRRQRTREAAFMYSIGVYVQPIDEKTAPCKYFCLASASYLKKKS